MRYTHIKLVNYIGIYNGLGLNELYIDFSKSRHKMTIIKGDNGSGKSTLFKALNPLPDSNDFFIPSLNASKEIGLIDNGTVYILKFIHDVKSNGERSVTKAYIYKLFQNGSQQNLNPNGNVSSFKDIIYEEFKLDSNFVTLSQLSNDDKGLADKKPAERKKFVNSIVESLETYNGIYKTLSKKSSIFKSMINSISTKLSNIGDLNILSSKLVDIINRLSILEDRKNILIENRANAKASINMLDPDNSIQIQYKELTKELENINSTNTSINIDIKKLLSKGIPIEKDKIESELKMVRDRLLEISTNIQIIKNNVSTSLADREEDSKKLRIKIDKLKSLDDVQSLNMIKNNIKTLKEKINFCEDVFSKIGIHDAIKISKDEYISALNILKDIKDIIDTFKSDTDYSLLQIALEYVSSKTYPDIQSLNIQLENAKELDNKYNNMIIEINNRDNILLQLNNKPEDCNIKDCGFVNSILDSIKGMPVESLKEVELARKINFEQLQTLQLRIPEETTIVEYINKIKIIIRTINNNKGLLQKFNTGILYMDELEIFRKFINGESFKYIDELYSYIDYANLFEEYKIYKDQLNVYNNKLDIYNSKVVIADEITKDIEELNISLNKITEKITNNNNILKELEQEQMALTSKDGYLTMAMNIINNKIEFDAKVIEIQSKLSKICGDMDTIQNSMNIVNSTTFEESNINIEIKKLNDEKEKIHHAMQLHDDYNREMDIYKSKYNTIETIKYYSSPTTGIQLVFMELYMSKIISLANQLLSYLFNGRFVIQPFIITESDFKIPVIGNGYANDDVTSLSSGEKAMISMIISLAMLYQSSTKYNVLKLDEIDAPLDTSNRLQFLIVLDQLIDILQSEQCIMISHNTEINTDNVDLIILKNSSGEQYNGNIIYQF